MKLFGLIGKPLTHSFSADFFNRKFADENIDARYENFEIDNISQLPDLLRVYPGLQGLNVTSPYKREVMRYLDSIDTVAQQVGAVNVIRIQHGGEGKVSLHGYNSDVPGFAGTIDPEEWCGTGALILGTGGAADACRTAFAQLGIESQLVSRHGGGGPISYGEITLELMSSHKIVVNATPLGMYPHIGEAPPMPYKLFTPTHLAYDLVYNPDVTEFMKQAAAYGAQTKNGLEMLLMQAFETWKIWR